MVNIETAFPRKVCVPLASPARLLLDADDDWDDDAQFERDVAAAFGEGTPAQGPSKQEQRYRDKHLEESDDD
jgi:hypothetical protein